MTRPLRVAMDGGWLDRIGWTLTRYDQAGRPIAVWQSDGTLSESTWGCCGKEYENDGQGIEHSYIHDALGRVAIQIKHGTSAGPWPAQPDQYTLFNYDAEGRQLSFTRSGGGISMTSSNSYDLAGRLIKSARMAQKVSTDRRMREISVAVARRMSNVKT